MRVSVVVLEVTVGLRIEAVLDPGEMEREAADLPSPNCIAVDRPIANGLSLSYRFKRAYLARWREMADGADALVRKFERH